MKFVAPKNISGDQVDSDFSSDRKKWPDQRDGPDGDDLKISDNISQGNTSLNESKKLKADTKISYYVRDKFQPLKSH